MSSSFEIMENRSDGSGKSGCFLSTICGFALVVVGIVVVALVAVIVFFAAAQPNIACSVDMGADTGANTGGQSGGDSGSGSGNPDLVIPANASAGGIWWPDKECLIDCIGAGYCSDEGSTTPKPGTDTPSTFVRDVRLPLDLKPVEYTVVLRPDIYTGNNETFKINGTVDIVLLCEKATNKVVVHINKLNVLRYSLVQGTTPVTIASVERDEPRQFINFTLPQGNMLEVGKEYTLSITFFGNLTNGLAGLYWSSYEEANEQTGQPEKRFIATTQFQPTDARMAFPCLDEPALKANFTISLERKDGYTALSNMPQSNTDTLDAGWYRDNFNPTVKMSTYLLAFIVCDFAQQNRTINSSNGNEVNYRVWSRKSALSQTDYALQQGVDQLLYFEEFFSEPYPLPKVDMIAIPDFSAGAMENWGLITYRETAMLYDITDSAASNKQRVSVVVSHELAHQWFGNIVTPTWWDDLWLNEGFASYVEYLGVNKTEPTWEMLNQFVITDVHNTMVSDSLASSHPIYVPVQHPDEINQIFDSISYGKGASLIRMMRFFVGDTVFQEGLSKYIDAKKYDAATHTELWGFIQVEATQQGLKDQNGKPIDVAGILDTWLLQMGFPVVTIEISTPAANGDTRLTMTQSHFLQDKSPDNPPDPKYPSPFGYKWDIPIAYVTSTDPDFEVTENNVMWFYKEDASMTIQVPSNLDWIIVNPKEYGFYRVNYPSSYWNKITDQLKTNHLVIDTLNRGQIIDDAFSLAVAGELSIEFAMSLTSYLENEKDYYAWETAIGSLNYVGMALKTTEAHGDFEAYMTKLVTPLYNKEVNNFVVDPTESIIDQYLQSLAISQACKYNIGDCRTQAKSKFAQYMADNTTNPVHANLRSTVYCYALRQGGVEEWDFAFAMFKQANVAAEQIKLLSSLGCTEEQWLLHRMLAYTLDSSKIRSQDATTSVASVAGNSLGKYIAWNWVRGNWALLNEKFSAGIMNIARYITYTTRNMFTGFELQQIDKFIEDTGDLGRASNAFAQAQEKTRANIKYLETNYATLAAWLSANK